ncbi:MAG: cupin domain-containing protein [Lachnospiraceae bacterium]|nr:cupin domain-containing protein [Lachnospiraceae bacterium]
MKTLGAKLKAIREEKEYTLKQVAERSGLSIGFISQVERDQTDPSLSSLKKLVAALDVKLGSLFDQEEAAHVVVKHGEGRILEIDSKVTCELLATTPGKTMEPMFKTIEPGGESGLVDPHGGEEFILVEEGSLHVQIGSNQYDLFKGDSVYFEGNQPHAWSNKTDQTCVVLWVMTPPSYS